MENCYTFPPSTSTVVCSKHRKPANKEIIAWEKERGPKNSVCLMEKNSGMIEKKEELGEDFEKATRGS